MSETVYICLEEDPNGYSGVFVVGTELEQVKEKVSAFQKEGCKYYITTYPLRASYVRDPKLPTNTIVGVNKPGLDWEHS